MFANTTAAYAGECLGQSLDAQCKQELLCMSSLLSLCRVDINPAAVLGKTDPTV